MDASAARAVHAEMRERTVNVAHAGRSVIGLWLGSFAIAAVLLYCYFGAPLFAIILGGAVALTATLLRAWWRRRRGHF